MKMKGYDSAPMSDTEDDRVELRRKRDAGDPPSPITFIPVRKQSHLPSISEIHHLRLSLNEQLMHAANNNNHNNHATSFPSQQSGKRTKPPFVTAPSSPTSLSAARKLLAVSSPPSMTNGSATINEGNDLHPIREQCKGQKSFVHSNHENEMRRELKTHRSSSSKEVAESGPTAASFKRNSFLRNSWNVILRQSIRLSGGGSHGQRGSWENGGSGVKRTKGRSSNGSGSEKSENVPPTPTNSKCSSDSEFLGNRFTFQSLRRKAAMGKATAGVAAGSGSGHKRNSSTSSFFSNSSSNSISATENGGTKTLTRSSSSGVVQEGSPAWINSTTCRGNSDAERRTHSAASNGNKWETTDGGRRSGVSKQSVNLMRSPSYQSTTSAMKNDIKLSSKNAQLPSSASPTSSSKDSDKPGKSSKGQEPEVVAPSKDSEKKEKKRKALSNSRQKKFFRHFPQVNPEEHVINYFSCALVSDILLQGHMYITANYFAFYSNVFGFVTKLLIPVVSVERISKEKVAKIIPNAIGVATADERHVFGSFMSREAAYRLMLSVWRPAETPETPTPVQEVAPVDVENSECSIGDESSCSASGNESPGVSKDGTTPPLGQPGLLMRQRTQPPMETSTSSGGLQGAAGGVDAVDHSSRLKANGGEAQNGGELLSAAEKEAAHRLAGGESIKQRNVTAVVVRESRVVWLKKRVQQINLKFPTDIHIVYLGVILAIVLALFSGFLLYRIMDIQARTSHLDYHWQRPNREMDVYEEVLKWQREIQERSVEETQTILNINLEQILKVRKSLESLSAFINGRRDSPGKGQIDSSMKT